MSAVSAVPVVVVAAAGFLVSHAWEDVVSVSVVRLVVAACCALGLAFVTTPVVSASVAPGAGVSVGASAVLKLPRVRACSWEVTDYAGTYDCDSKAYRAASVPTTLYSCWAASPTGAIAQQLVGGAWVNDPSPVTIDDDAVWECPSGFTHASIIHVSLPASPLHRVYSFRVFVPAHDGYADAVGLVSRACVKRSASDHECR